MPGVVRRRLYKPERKPARKRGTLYKLAPLGCIDANEGEVAKALFAIAREGNVIIGQGSGYDSLRDEYTVVGKVLDGGSENGVKTGKVQDVTIQGAEVAALIRFARRLNGGKMERPNHRRARVSAAGAARALLPGLPAGSR